MATRYGGRTEPSRNVNRWISNPQVIPPYTSTSVPVAGLVAITASSTIHTYGAWTEVIASTPNDTSTLYINIDGMRTNGTNTASIMSVGIGASGNETEFAAFAIGGAGEPGTYFNGLHLILPIAIDAGTRISARLQSLVASKVGQIFISTLNADPTTYPTINKTVDSLGLNLASSTGTDIAANNAYSQVVASTSQPYRGVVLVPSVASAQTGALGFTMTVAVGPAGSEVDIGAMRVHNTAGEAIYAGPSFFLPTFIPQGSRLAVKQSSGATYFDATILGVPF